MDYAPLVSLVSLLGLACTAAPPSESVDLPVERAPEAPAHTNYQHQPEAAPPPVDPETQPRLKLVRLDRSEDFGFFSGVMCNYDVEIFNVPAFDPSRGVFLDFEVYRSAGSEGEDDVASLHYFGLEDAPDAEQVYNRWHDLDEVDTEDEDAVARRCKALAAEVGARVDALNAKLVGTRWRLTESLDVIGEDGPYYDTGETYDIESLPLETRPVELLYNNRKMIFRVRKAKVLLALDRPEWTVDDEPYRTCGKRPRMRGIEVDRQTKLGLVYFDYSTGGCLCDDEVYQRVVEVPAEIFAEVDARPTAAAKVVED